MQEGKEPGGGGVVVSCVKNAAGSILLSENSPVRGKRKWQGGSYPESKRCALQ